MWLEYFFRGIITGFVASMLIGPVAVMIIQRTLSKNLRSGFASGLGCATADTFYATLAFFSFTLINSFIHRNFILISIIGGILVVLIGINIFFKNPIVQIRRNRTGKSSLWQDFLSVFLLTIANPGCFLIFVALFAIFGLDSSNMDNVDGMGMVIGVFAGAVSFWLALTSAVNMARKKFRPRHMLMMNRISGAIIVLFGIYAILSALIPGLSLEGLLQ